MRGKARAVIIKQAPDPFNRCDGSETQGTGKENEKKPEEATSLFEGLSHLKKDFYHDREEAWSTKKKIQEKSGLREKKRRKINI